MDLETYLWKNRIELKDFATKVGCHYSYISMIANNKRTPSLKLARKIEEVTNGQVKAKTMIKKKIQNYLKKAFPLTPEDSFKACVKKEIE